ncbi:hypothetical protein SPRG_12202 [Saprolegnia parasitica CBS 223.65]|uniref:FYVE-type domain-containing protein n=1 Tax=Saprolegnia parasitica (strain CBS 223.65) TaxID=695850 RepID=A0A067C0Z0_SAPPC|nr:hypothetical protein SPRG_12202 [Saprolegnia parasitica CBS 223.65]KDO22775.1 hypothetical protein SPRG_12202 [Saprolegnia parasitica CBS 223.65]|eukprot:XP_012206559.1 hypothetical protein SPRG_12202 [Saprolegnia parasitica CBS 223.65]
MEILDENVVPTVLVSTADAATYRNNAAMRCAKALQFDVKREIATSGWSLEDDRLGLKVYAKPMPGSSVAQYLAIGALPTTLPSLVDALYAETSNDQKILDSILLEHDFVNAGVLSVLEARQKDDIGDFLGLKYLKFNIAMSSAPRDLTYIEHSGTRINEQGARVLIVLRESVALSAMPEVKGTTRATMLASFVYTASPRGDVDVACRWFMDPNSSSLLLNCGAAKVRHMLLRTATLPAYRRIVTRPPASSWVPDADRKACVVCSKRFNALRSKHHCRLCGEIMCSGCTTKIVYVPACASQAVTGKYCTECVVLAKANGNVDVGTSSRHGSITSTIASTYASSPDVDDGASDVSSVRSLRSNRSMASLRERASVAAPPPAPVPDATIGHGFVALDLNAPSIGTTVVEEVARQVTRRLSAEVDV